MNSLDEKCVEKNGMYLKCMLACSPFIFYGIVVRDRFGSFLASCLFP